MVGKFRAWLSSNSKCSCRRSVVTARINGPGAQGPANTAWASGSTAVQSKAFVEALGHEVATRTPELSAQNLSNAAWDCTKTAKSFEAFYDLKLQLNTGTIIRDYLVLCHENLSSAMALASAPTPALTLTLAPAGGRRVQRGWSRSTRTVRATEGQEAPAEQGLSVAVVGAGPVGLLTALALARRGFRKVRVLDRLPEPPSPDAAVWGDPDRSYNLGIGGRGQRALAKFGALERVDRWSQTVVGRKDWSGEGEPKVTINKRRFLTKVIARDRLSSCLYEELREMWPDVEVQFSKECTAVDFSTPRPRLSLRTCGAREAEET
ncbi:kmo, partial [Symbiodinium necroappetens]